MTTTQTSTPLPYGRGGGRKGLRVFLIASFGAAWLLEGVIALLGGPTRPLALPVLVLVMFTPALAAVLARRVTGEGWEDSGLRAGRLIYYPLAWALVVILVGATAVATWLLWPQLLDPSAVMSILRQVPVPWPLLVVGAVIVAPIFNSLPAFGEELGWRGYLLPKLLFLGELQACVVSGAIWGLWHAPLVLQGYNFPRHPISGVLIMVVGSGLLGTLLGWLRLRSGSVFPAALAHGTINALAGVPLVLMPEVDTAYGGLVLGVLGWLPMAVAVAVLIARRQLASSTR